MEQTRQTLYLYMYLEHRTKWKCQIQDHFGSSFCHSRLDRRIMHPSSHDGGKELSNPGESGSSTQYPIGLFQEVPLPQHSYSQHPRTGHCSPLSPLKMPRLLVIVSCPCQVFTSKRSNTTAKPPTGLKATNRIIFFCAGKVNQAVLVLPLP
jgi:hypothetical protein